MLAQNLANAGIQWDFVGRLLMNAAFVTALIRGTYFRHYRRTDLFLTFFSFNLVIFLIAYLMTNVEISLGAAFGLFAVFSMLRYRTEGISTPDMTYLFTVIALGLLMGISNGGWQQLLLIGATLLIFTEALESGVLARRELAQHVHYDNVRLIAQEHRAELIRDLQVRTGLTVHRIDVEEIDFLKDAARLKVYHYARN